MKYKKRIVPVAIALLVTGSAVGYKKCQPKKEEAEKVTIKGNYFMKKDIDRIYETSYQVRTTITLEQKVDDDYEKSWFGSGTLLVDSQTRDNYIFTAEHITSDGTYKSKKGEVVKVIRERIMVDAYDAIVFKENEEYDLALLKLNGSLEKPFTGKIAKDINPGDYVIGVGFPDGNKELFSTRVAKTTDASTFLNISIVRGNSGGGVYLINNKELQFCGLVTKVDHIPSVKRVREFFKGTPLEDDYLQ